jgi:hypothetical protein
MADSSPSRVFTLLEREMLEYRNSLFWTPIVVALSLTAVAFFSVVVADRITAMGDAILEVIMEEESASGMNITLNINENDDGESELVVTRETAPQKEDDWEFNKEWRFNPQTDTEALEQAELDALNSGDVAERETGPGNHLNPALHMVHSIMLLVLMLVSVNYLLSTLYTDRKDRSVLFWKSLPVSEWEEVLAKMATALIVVPAIFIGISLLTQLAYVLLAMLLVTRMDQDAFDVVLGNVDLTMLLSDQLAGWLLTVLWVAPAAAWLLLASAAAKRSPFMLAFVPVAALGILEELFLGSEMISDAVRNHIPHHFDNDGVVHAVGFYFGGPNWSQIEWSSLLAGLALTPVLLWCAVWLRRYRFEI